MPKNISSLTGLIKNDRYIAADMDTWLLMEFDLKERTSHIICNLSQGEPNWLLGCKRMLEIENSIYFIFRNSRRIIEYNVVQQKVYHYGDEYEGYEFSILLYNDAYYWNGKIVMLPYDINASILLFDVRTKKYTEEISFQRLFSQAGVELEKGEIHAYVKQGDKLWFCIYESSWVGCVDFAGMSNLCLWQCAQSNHLWEMRAGADCIFLTETESRRFLKMDTVTHNIELYDVVDSELQENEGGYRFIEAFREKIIAIPRYANSMSVIGKNGNIKNVRFPEEFRIIPEVRQIKVPFADYVVDAEKLYLFPFSCNGMIVINMTDDTVSYYPMKLVYKDISQWYCNRGIELSVMREVEESCLEDFLSILDESGNMNRSEREVNLIGRKIFNMIRRML